MWSSVCVCFFYVEFAASCSWTPPLSSPSLVSSTHPHPWSPPVPCTRVLPNDWTLTDLNEVAPIVCVEKRACYKMPYPEMTYIRVIPSSTLLRSRYIENKMLGLAVDKPPPVPPAGDLTSAMRMSFTAGSPTHQVALVMLA